MSEKWIKSRNLILEILNKYELGDAYLVLQGIDLLGYENMIFWLDLVNYVKKYKGIESLVAYIDAMQLLGKEKLVFYMNDINDKSSSFKEKYERFIALLSETKKYSSDMFNLKIKK